MTLSDYLLHLFYLIDSELEACKSQGCVPARLRLRGHPPLLCDSEVITIELAGEFLGIDTDKGIYQHFRHYHLDEFPALAQVNRTTFVRQAANLLQLKQLLHRRLLERLPLNDALLEGQAAKTLWLIDSFPLRICRVVRARFAKLFKGLASFGRDPALAGRHCFYGLRVHLRASSHCGAIAQIELAPANVADVVMAADLAPGAGSIGVGDRNYWSPQYQRELQEQQGFTLLASFKKKSSDPDPQRSILLGHVRQITEVVIGQLATHFNAERTWARDLWHLCSRLIRKVLSHTAALLLNAQQGNPPLQLERLID